MKILLIHNRYQERGGEDACFEAEARMLQSNGHQVFKLEFSNNEISNRRGPMQDLSLARTTIWSSTARAQLRNTIRTFQPVIAHFHNTFPLVSPGAYSAVRDTGIPVVQTLHNYRLLCPGATLYRDGQVCEDCLGKLMPYPGVRHACYRGSTVQSGVAAAMIGVHRIRGTWRRDVNRYIALTTFMKERFVAGGIPDDMITVKPNFVDLPMVPNAERAAGFLFVGRFAPEKGLAPLLEASALAADLPLELIGDGPEFDRVANAANHQPTIRVSGRQPTDVVHARMREATALVFPSTWYEGFPVTIVEAFACGLPVIVSSLGSMAEIVEDGKTGLHFKPGDPADLARVMQWAASHPVEMREMGRNARKVYEEKYTPATNYTQLIEIYDRVLEPHQNKSRPLSLTSR